jgi:hypothetical protein
MSDPNTPEKRYDESVRLNDALNDWLMRLQQMKDKVKNLPFDKKTSHKTVQAAKDLINEMKVIIADPGLESLPGVAALAKTTAEAERKLSKIHSRKVKKKVKKVEVREPAPGIVQPTPVRPAPAQPVLQGLKKRRPSVNLFQHAEPAGHEPEPKASGKEPTKGNGM